ncbi:MAG: cytochrome P460 family protein [Cyanobacteria bacterium SZAS LIN-3]|nr:cytochrome P460 family protein [Cyanobacteria bacterium SZAS LIN-3]
MSASKDVSTHGQKVYFLYARDPGQYFRDEAPKPGQVVVKESWAPASDSTGKAGTEPAASDKPLGLFVMMKLDPKTPSTDNGWVYGTISADGKSVTSAGRVQSCMGCHASASNDRLFGLVK